MVEQRHVNNHRSHCMPAAGLGLYQGDLDITIESSLVSTYGE